jgi:hypothetical protein
LSTSPSLFSHTTHGLHRLTSEKSSEDSNSEDFEGPSDDISLSLDEKLDSDDEVLGESATRKLSTGFHAPSFSRDGTFTRLTGFICRSGEPLSLLSFLIISLFVLLLEQLKSQQKEIQTLRGMNNALSLRLTKLIDERTKLETEVSVTVA